MMMCITSKFNRFLFLLVFATVVCLLQHKSEAQDAPGNAISPEHMAFFESKIRPVLVEHCLRCHSQEAEKQGNLKANLLLDSREGILRGGDSGPAFDAEHPDHSLLLQALRYEEYQMPPSGKLSAAVIEDFEKWIAIGAPDPRVGQRQREIRRPDIQAGRQLWSLQPLMRPDVPKTASNSSNSNVVDTWIDKQLAAKHLEATSRADERTLVRRLYFDLLGLPPSPDELEQALALLQGPDKGDLHASSNSDSASGGANTQDKDHGTQPSTFSIIGWKKLIDQLLDRPEYGERWARHWMDVVRFAESFGYEQDYNRPNAYHYRDFLIRALNDDLPYDQFLQWQIAGDELQPDNPQAWMATGFLGAGAFPTQLTESEFESTRYNELDDMVSTIGVSFLGLSIGCARCHDHKFDPITAEDYYRFASTFTSVIRSEKNFDLAPDENAKRREDYDLKVQQAKHRLEEFERTELDREFVDFLLRSIDTPEKTVGPWQVLGGTLTSESASVYVAQSDGSFLAQGASPAKETLTFEFRTNLRNPRALRIEALNDPTLPRGGPGRADNGNFALGHLTAELLAEGKEPRAVQFVGPSATHQQNSDSLSIAASLDQDMVSGWAVDGQIGKSQAAVVFFAPGEGASVLEIEPTDVLRLHLRFHHPNSKHIIGRIRFSISTEEQPPVEVGGKEPPAEVLAAMTAAIPELKKQVEKNATLDAMTTEMKHYEQWPLLRTWYKSLSAGWLELKKQLTDLESQGPPVQWSTVLVTTEGEQHLPHHADDRGYPHFYPQTHILRRGDVEQKLEVATPGIPEVFLGRGRDDASLHWERPRENPKSSYRRAGLALWLTDVDHGAGALAARVLANRVWMHHFGRGLVATPNDFGMTGEKPTHPELLEWLASELVVNRWSIKSLHRTILSSEAYMRSNRLPNDLRLATDPDNRLLWYRSPRRIEAEAVRDSLLSCSGMLDRSMFGPGSLDPSMKRRSVYFFIKRSQLIPMLMLFDWPEHLVSIGQRQSTTVAPQALALMNSPVAREAAERLASQAMAKPDRVLEVFMKVLSRVPSEQERRLVDSLYQNAVRERGQSPNSNVELMAFADVCQVLFCSNEFLYVD